MTRTQQDLGPAVSSCDTEQDIDHVVERCGEGVIVALMRAIEADKLANPGNRFQVSVALENVRGRIEATFTLTEGKPLH